MSTRKIVHNYVRRRLKFGGMSGNSVPNFSPTVAAIVVEIVRGAAEYPVVG
jgi:hypothetical protein